MTNEAEIWMNVDLFEGLYQISNLGRVKSLERLVQHNVSGFLPIKERILRAGLATNGYMTVSLRKGGRKRTHYVHRLIADAFLPNPFKLKCINHIDGNKLNNSISNLEWVSYSGNSRHAVDTGLMPVFWNESNVRCKLSVKDIEEIRLLSESGKMNIHIAEIYGVHPAHISKIVNNKRRSCLHLKITRAGINCE